MAMTNRTGILLLALASVLVACGDDDVEQVAGGPTTSAASFTPPAGGTLVEWTESAGECPECAYDLRLEAGDVAVFESAAGEIELEHDAVTLRAELDRLDPTELVIGRDDCGREVDGNAPVLVLHRADATPLEIDDCYETIDREHPLMVLVLEVFERADNR